VTDTVEVSTFFSLRFVRFFAAKCFFKGQRMGHARPLYRSPMIANSFRSWASWEWTLSFQLHLDRVFADGDTAEIVFMRRKCRDGGHARVGRAQLLAHSPQRIWKAMAHHPAS